MSPPRLVLPAVVLAAAPPASGGGLKATIDTDSVLARTLDEYASWNLDSTDNREFFTRNLRNPQLIDFAKDLAPSFMRVGGTGAKFLYYQVGADKNKTWNGTIDWSDGKYHWNWPPKYLNETLWDDVCNLAGSSGAKLVFNICEAVFAKDNGSNLRALLEYSIKKGCKIAAIETSNEQGVPTPEMIKAIYHTVQGAYPAGEAPVLIGPDESVAESIVQMRDNANKVGVSLFGTTYHDYNDEHKFSKCEGVLKPFVKPNSSLFYGTNGRTWIGESATCGQGGLKNISDTFASGLWYWSYLGRHAQLNHAVFLRQTIVGGNYGLLRDRFWDHTMEGDALFPNADYFSNVLFTRQMGNEVFNTTTSDIHVQVYAHCSRRHKGGLAVAVINYNTEATQVVLDNAQLGEESAREEWIMTSNDPSTVFSKFANINGNKLTSVKDLVGVAGKGNTLTLPPQSYGVVVYPDAAVGACN